MSYRCPLCLKPLNERHELTRHCTLHPERDETFDCQPHLLPYKIFCPDADCESPDQIAEGVFLRHAGCEEHNPFWDGRRVDVPGDAHQSRVEFSTDFGTGDFQPIFVQHWLLGRLRNLPGDRPEMWFPLMLLRATGERNGSSRVGRFIELAGARNAGKTILAVQALNPHGYAGGFVDLNDFSFSRRVGEITGYGFRWYVETLHLSSLLSRGVTEIFLPQGTPHGTRNLKVAFFKPAGFGGIDARPSGRGWQERARRVARVAWHGSKRFLKEDVHASFAEIFGSQGFRPYWHTLAFYDKAGEVFEHDDVATDTLDKVAVVVNAAEIFGLDADAKAVRQQAATAVLELDEEPTESPEEGKARQPAESHLSEKSIEVAVQRLRKAAERKQVCYLVVTQLDRARRQIGEADWGQVVDLADDLSAVGRDRGSLRKAWTKLFPARSSEARALLEKWLSTHPSGNRRQLKERLKDVEEIFFVWTENLPGSYTPARQEALPRSHGLAKFICRCLDVEWGQIDRGDKG
ncbi:MAG TPA: hypothetical protein VIP46_16790 [Pyrinomonadaceae bacterium]